MALRRARLESAADLDLFLGTARPRVNAGFYYFHVRIRVVSLFFEEFLDLR